MKVKTVKTLTGGGKLVVCLLGVSMCSGMLLAADQSLNWAAGANPRSLGANGELVFTYDASDKVQTLSATIAAGDTITLSGDDITFAADAKISSTSNGKLVFANNVVTAGKLTIGDSAEIAYAGNELSGTDYTVMFPGKNLADYAVKYTHFRNGAHGNLLLTGTGLPFHEVRGTVSGANSLTVEMQIWDWSYTRGVKLELVQQGADIAGRIVAAAYYQPYIYCLGESFYDTARTVGIDAKFISDTPNKKNGYNIDHLVMTNCTMAVSDVAFAGTLTLGGALEVGDLGKVSTTGSETLTPANGTFSGALTVNGEMTIKDHDDFTFSGTLAGSGKTEFVSESTKTKSPTFYEEYYKRDYAVVAHDRQLSKVVSVSAKMSGAYFGGVVVGPVQGCFWSYDAETDTATCQFQYEQSGPIVKCAIVEYRQNGQNIEGRIIYSRYGNGYHAGENDMITTYTDDYSGTALGVGQNAGSYAACQTTMTYDQTPEPVERIVKLNSLVNSMDRIGRLSFRGGNGGSSIVARIECLDALPFLGFTDVGTNATLQLIKSGAFGKGVFNNTGSKGVFRIYPGGTLETHNSYQIAWDQELRVLGGTVDQKFNSYNFYIDKILIADGGTIKGCAPRHGYYMAKTYICAAGLKPNTISMPMRLLDNNNNAAELFISVSDVREDGAPTLILSGGFDIGDTYKNIAIGKYGPGTVLQTGTVAIEREINIHDGKWILGANGVCSRNIVLSGGTLGAAAGAANTLGTLSFTANGGLDIAAGGKLSFDADTTGWAAGKVIRVTGDGADCGVRVGSSKVLSRAECRSFLFGDKAPRQRDDGWLTAVPLGARFQIR